MHTNGRVRQSLNILALVLNASYLVSNSLRNQPNREHPVQQSAVGLHRVQSQLYGSPLGCYERTMEALEAVEGSKMSLTAEMYVYQMVRM